MTETVVPSASAHTHRTTARMPLAASLRAAGIAAIVGACAWLVPLGAFVLTLSNPDNMADDQTLAQWQAANPFGAVVGAAYLVLGVALAVVVTAAGRARGIREPGTPGLPMVIADWLGGLGAASLVLAGAMDLTLGGLVGSSFTMIPDASEGARWLAHQSVVTVHEALRLATCLGFAAWLVVFSRVGRRARVIGRAVSVTIVVAAVILAIPGAVTGLLTGMNFLLLALIPLAVAFLRRSRKAV